MPTFVSFRSHLDILSVSSDLFYDSELQACATDRPQQQLFVRGGCDFLPNPKSPIVFHGVRGKNLQEPDSPSWFNPNEAFQARISCNFSWYMYPSLCLSNSYAIRLTEINQKNKCYNKITKDYFTEYSFDWI